MPTLLLELLPASWANRVGEAVADEEGTPS
jgi:hypothetical protein